MNYKGVVESYQAARSEKYTTLEGVLPVLTWTYKDGIYKDQIRKHSSITSARWGGGGI